METLIDYAAFKQPVEFADLFNSIMADKAAARLEDVKQQIASSLYSDGEDYGDVDDDDDEFINDEDLFADLENELFGDEDEDS